MLNLVLAWLVGQALFAAFAIDFEARVASALQPYFWFMVPGALVALALSSRLLGIWIPAVVGVSVTLVATAAWAAFVLIK